MNFWKSSTIVSPGNVSIPEPTASRSTKMASNDFPTLKLPSSDSIPRAEREKCSWSQRLPNQGTFCQALSTFCPSECGQIEGVLVGNPLTLSPGDPEYFGSGDCLSHCIQHRYTVATRNVCKRNQAELREISCLRFGKELRSMQGISETELFETLVCP